MSETYKLTDEQIAAIGIEHGHACKVEGYPCNALWFDGDLTPFARSIESAVSEPLLARIAELEADARFHRWNIEEDGDDLLICNNHHEKGEKCEYIRYTPESCVSTLEAELAGVRKDAERLDWLLLCVSGMEFRRIGVFYVGNAQREDIDSAMQADALTPPLEQPK